MQKKKIFISSVQSEFSKERKLLTEFLTSETLLGKFFDVFLFENLPAINKGSEKVYLNEVKQCDIYIGLFGKEYGHEDSKGISATEKEFNCAVKNHKIKLIFLTIDKDKNRHPKEIKLIKKAEKFVVRKKFSNEIELKTSVYNALIRYLEENEYIRTLPFDATLNHKATLDDLDDEKIKSFVHIAHNKRAFPFTHNIDIKTILTHLNLIENEKVTNAAILLFGKKPQKFFINSEIRCAHFHGYDVQKPIPNYQVYKGNLFELITQAVNFVLSNIIVSTGSRDYGEKSQEIITNINTSCTNQVTHQDPFQLPIKHPSSTHQVTIKYENAMIELLVVIKGEMTRKAIQNSMKLSDRVNFRLSYLQPAIEQSFVSMKYPESPNHPKQRYLLTQKGKELIKKK